MSSALYTTGSQDVAALYPPSMTKSATRTRSSRPSRRRSRSSKPLRRSRSRRRVSKSQSSTKGKRRLPGYEKSKGNENHTTCLSVMFLLQLLIAGLAMASIILAHFYSNKDVKSFFYGVFALQAEFLLFSFFGMFYMTRHIGAFLTFNSAVIFCLEFGYVGYLFFTDLPAHCQENGCTFTRAPLYHRIAILCTMVAYSFVHMVTTAGYLAVTTSTPTKEQLMKEDIERMSERRKKRSKDKRSRKSSRRLRRSRSSRASVTTERTSEKPTRVATVTHEPTESWNSLVTASANQTQTQLSDQIDSFTTYARKQLALHQPPEVQQPVQVQQSRSDVDAIAHAAHYRDYLESRARADHVAQDPGRCSIKIYYPESTSQVETIRFITDSCVENPQDSNATPSPSSQTVLTPGQNPNQRCVHSYASSAGNGGDSRASVVSGLMTPKTSRGTQTLVRVPGSPFSDIDPLTPGGTETTNENRDVILPDSFTNIPGRCGRSSQAIFVLNNPIEDFEHEEEKKP